MDDPRTLQKLLTFEQLVSRCGAQTTVVPVASMPCDRIVDAALVSTAFHPRFIVVVNPATYRRACYEADRRWGRGGDGIPGFDVDADIGFQFGPDLVIHVSAPQFVVDVDEAEPISITPPYPWRIRL